MSYRLGPWGTRFDHGPAARLSSFWKRRLELLPESGSSQRRTSRWVAAGLALFAIVGVLLPAVSSRSLRAEVPDSPPVAEASNKVTAEGLMRQLYDDESGPARVDGMLIKIETVQERTEEGQKPLPRIPGPFKMSDKPLEKTLTIRFELAWDKDRVMTANEIIGATRSQSRRTFSGALAIEEATRLENGAMTSQSFVLDDKVDLIFQHSFAHNLRWGTLTRHMGPFTWWRKPDSRSHGSQTYNESLGMPRYEGLRLRGRTTYEGQECDCVEWPLGNDRFYFRTSDRRLLGAESYRSTLSTAADLQLKSKIAGVQFETHNDWKGWLDGQSPESRIAAEGRYQAERERHLVLGVDKLFDDFRELAPGIWYPFRIRFRSYHTDSGESKLAVISTGRVVEAVVNPTLPDALFEHEIPDGANVSTDWRYDPPIRYTYHPAQTEAEREKLAATARAQQEEGRKVLEDVQKGVDERLGQTLPALSRDGWINSPPLSWQDLRGKAVEIAFWDIGCGPCHFTLDLMQQAAADAKLRGQAFIAIHRATKDRAAVEKELAKNKWTMPVLIDGDGSDAEHPSYYDWLQIKAMPWVVLVNREGVIVAHGLGTFGSDIFAKYGELSRTGQIKPERSAKAR
ncbi:MAG: TlpA family protein disulfide reductase [Planctomycetaceae bacterium]|nr:TlpA family protein disulfide reductase [Planctomycetaceae bacterium]